MNVIRWVGHSNRELGIVVNMRMDIASNLFGFKTVRVTPGMFMICV